MSASFKQEPIFSKGICYAEWFDVSTDNLLGFSQFVTNFGLNGTMNNGEVEGGVGNGLVMMIPDSARLAVTAQTADANLNNMALPIGATVGGNGVIETVIGVTATGTSISVSNAVAPLGGQNGAVCYVLSSSGSDRTAVEADSGIAYPVANDGTITGFTAVSGNTYCVKYFVENSSALKLSIPALFAPKVVRAHFAVNLYAKKAGNSVMESSIVGIRHYYFPYYFFTAGLQDTASQTSTGTTDLSGQCLSFEEAIAAGSCANSGAMQYGFIVDEQIGADSSTSNVKGIYFIGGGAGATVAVGNTINLPIKYDVNDVLTNISDMSAVTFESSVPAKATVNGNAVTGVAAGDTVITATVTNSRTGVQYSDTINVTVTA